MVESNTIIRVSAVGGSNTIIQFSVVVESNTIIQVSAVVESNTFTQVSDVVGFNTIIQVSACIRSWRNVGNFADSLPSTKVVKLTRFFTGREWKAGERPVLSLGHCQY